MQENNYSENEKNEIKKAKHANYIIFVIFLLIAAAIFAWFCLSKYWQGFSHEKWLNHPEKRAVMTGDLFENYELIGMTETEITDLLGQNNNDYGYFNKENRYVYYLGEERTIMDSEWLVIDFRNGIVADYAIVQD